MNIDRHISELLYQYDCVVVPGFGGFVANYSPAKIHPVRHTFSPPSKNISFNKNLVNNDGLLANRIAGEEGYSYSEANKFIENFVETCNNGLRKGIRVEIKNIGEFYCDSEQNIQFDPDRKVNYLTESFGMVSFQSPAIKRESIEEKLEKEFIGRTPLASGPKPSVHGIRIKKYRMAILALPLILLLLWIPLKTNFFDDFSFNYSGLNPFTKSPVTEESLSESNVTPHLPDETALSGIDVSSESRTTTPTPPDKPDEYSGKYSGKSEKPVESNETKKFIPDKSFSSKKRYHVIGGCFKNFNNAKRLVKKLKKLGYDARLAGQNDSGLYRVSYGGHTTREDALEELAMVREKHIQTAWLLII